MTKLLISLILLNLTFSCGKGFDKKNSGPQRTQEALTVDTFTLNQEYLTLINEFRIDLKLKPLVYSAILERIAKEHSKGMATHSRPFGHMGFGTRCRRAKKRLAPHKLCGEIVAMGQKNPREVLKAWIGSPKHLEQIQHNRYNTTAVGIYQDEKGVIYWTQMFVEL